MTRPRGPVVALVSDAVYPYHRGGKELRYYELTRRLAARAEVHVHTMHWWSGPRVRIDDGVTYHAISPLLPLYSHSRRSYRQAVIFAIACVRLLGARFDVLEADHIPYFQILVLRLVATVRRKRFVVTWHEVWGQSYWREYLGPAGFAAWFIEWLAMRLPDHIVAASPQTAEKLRIVLGPSASITTAPNGIDLDGARVARPDRAATDFVVVSRLIAHKRVGMLLEAVAILQAEGTPVTCRVIGDGPEKAALHDQAEALGVSHAVDFRHDVHRQEDVFALVKAAEAFVFPSAREGFGIAVLEALACGVPVITTSAPDNLAQHLAARSSRGVICDPSASGLAKAMRSLLAEAGSPDGHPGWTGEEDSWLSEYSWDATADQVARAFQI